MDIKNIDPSAALNLMLKDFGIDSTEQADFNAEVNSTLLACLVRRASGIMCPNSESNLIQAVLEPLNNLYRFTSEAYEEQKNKLDLIIGSLTAIGDLREESTPRKQIYPGSPSFVRRRNGDIILIGVVPETINAVPDSLTQFIRHQGVLRHVDAAIASQEVQDSGLIEISETMWTDPPIYRSPFDHIEDAKAALNASTQSPDGLDFQRFLDPSSLTPRSRSDYDRRWSNRIPRRATEPISVVRESSPGPWFFAEINEGEVTRCLPLPISTGRACDAAWRLQHALDAVKGCAPIARIGDDHGTNRILKLYSPPLQWASRRWDLVGSQLSVEECRKQECLFGWRFEGSVLDAEVAFLEEELWHSVEYE